MKRYKTYTYTSYLFIPINDDWDRRWECIAVNEETDKLTTIQKRVLNGNCIACGIPLDSNSTPEGVKIVLRRPALE